jgi:AraC-like DNA-binding protein
LFNVYLPLEPYRFDKRFIERLFLLANEILLMAISHPSVPIVDHNLKSVVKELDLSIEPGIRLLSLRIPFQECQINQLPIPKDAECLIAVHSLEQGTGCCSIDKVAISALHLQSASKKLLRLYFPGQRVFVFLISKQEFREQALSLSKAPLDCSQLPALHGVQMLNISFQEETTRLLHHTTLARISRLEWNYFAFQTLKAYFHIQEGIERSGRPKTSSEDLTHAALRFMEQHIEGSILSINQIADHCAVSPSKLKTLFKETTAQSVYRYYLDLRLDHASELLQTTGLNVSEVAFRIGYANISKFSKMFKERHGRLPSEMRQVSTTQPAQKLASS